MLVSELFVQFARSVPAPHSLDPTEQSDAASIVEETGNTYFAAAFCRVRRAPSLVTRFSYCVTLQIGHVRAPLNRS